MTTAKAAPRIATVWMSRKEAAEYLGVEPQTLAVWASTGRYKLPYYRCGSKVARYKQADLDRFLESRLVESSAAGGRR